MSPSNIIDTIINLIYPLRQPAILWGSPGIGKSDVVAQAAKAIDGELIDLRGSLLDPVDMRGVPWIDKEKNHTHWARPCFIPSEGRGIVFLDELGQASGATQAAMLQLCLDRQVGEAKLGDGWAVIAASNNADDRAGANRLITPLLNRFVHIDMDVSNDDWHAWAVANRIAPEVRSFLKFKPELLDQFKAAKDAGHKAFATPRSWSFVSKMFPNTPSELRAQLFSGTIGAGPATEFTKYLKFYEQLPRIDQIIASPATEPIPEEIAVLWAVCAALPDHLMQAHKKWVHTQPGAQKDELKARMREIVKSISIYAGRMPEREFSVMLMKDTLAVWDMALEVKEMMSWVAANRDLMIANTKFAQKKKSA